MEIKEKNAVYLVDMAEARGDLKPGGTIVESSSGNFGVGLAIVGAARGYRVIVVVDAKTAPPFRRMLKAYGAELEEVPLSLADETGSMQKARVTEIDEPEKKIAELRKIFRVSRRDKTFKGNLQKGEFGIFYKQSWMTFRRKQHKGLDFFHNDAQRWQTVHLVSVTPTFAS